MPFAKRIQYLLGPRRIAIAEACVIGLVSGLAAVFLKQGISWLTAWRTAEVAQAWYLLPGMGLVGGLLAGWLITWLAPEASGSGIPQVKAVLGYVSMPLNLRVAVVKLLSTVLALGSGLSLGRQGPTVQVGAALAAQLSRWVPTSPEYRQQLIAAGAAAGLAAGFNAPIAGVLFVVEELLQDFSDLTLGTAILASFIGAVVSRLLGGQGLNLSMSTFQASLTVQDLPFLALLGLLSGLLGALFRRGIFLSLDFYRQLRGLSLAWRVGLAGLATGVVGLLLPVAAADNTGLRESLVTGEASWQVIAIAFVTKFALTLLAYGSGASGGIFAPALVLGSALGCLTSFFAQALQSLAGFAELANTTTYALTGMGAFFSAVTRVPITAIVMVFEITTDFNLVLPLMIGAAIAYLVSDQVDSGSIYTRLLENQGVRLEQTPSESNPWANLKAADLMQQRVETLSVHLPIAEAMQAFARSHHRGFPVTHKSRLVGIVTQTDLSKAGNSLDASLKLADIMTPDPVTVGPEASLTHVLHLLNRLKVSRLPVVEGPKLVGIITRGDIIRAESDQVSGQKVEPGPQSEPSYLAYQTRAPAVGTGRLLVPLNDLEAAPQLLEVAAAIAHQYRYELECVHIVLVQRSLSPSEVAVDLATSHQLLQLAHQVSDRYCLPVHTQVRVAHEVAHTLLEIVKERHINLILMEWQRRTNTPDRILGTVVDTIVRQAPCHVVVFRPGRSKHFDRWLLPLAGGPNAQKALQLLPALATLGKPQVYLCHISTPQEDRSYDSLPQLRQAARKLKSQLNAAVETVTLQNDSIATAIAQLARIHHSDVILLGASREGLLSHVLKGNIPIEIAQYSDCHILLVRRALSPSWEMFK
ncbi:MAG: universal stress protein [Leptolyngbyaceae cyanobacterium SM1_1_3]|nr:universal stress protein [Leptolyngbyaceae cyanobacterium SM1_1_3]NJN01882.1 universal stress protein [Leptolyngbyaceae cyanobacterium RM1_1_2]